MDKERLPTIVAADQGSVGQPGGIVRELPESWCLKFKSIDHEHQNLINDLNAGWDVFGQAASVRFAEFEATFISLKRDMQQHFASEESEMASLSYPGLEEHKAQHQSVMEKLEKIEASAATAGIVNREHLYSLLDALVDDVLRADIPFKTYLFDRGLIK